MSRARFVEVWYNLHVVDNAMIIPADGVGRKIKPVLDALSHSFVRSCSPSQEMSVDEAMVKYTGCVKGKS